MIVKTRMQRERERHEAKAAVLIAQAARSAHEKTLRYGERSTHSPRTPRHTRGQCSLMTHELMALHVVPVHVAYYR